MSFTKVVTEELINSESTKPIVSLQQVADYHVYIVTWNVGTRFPDNITLRNLLGLQSHDIEGNKEVTQKVKLPDIYAIGLQEVNIEPKQQVRGLFKVDPWTAKATSVLGEYDYVAFKTEQMQGLLLSLFCRRQHIAALRDVEAEFTRTGFGGIWGNKGAVSIRFNLYGCGLVFIVAHLAAHDQHLDERIEDYKQIIEKHHYHVSRYREIQDHDYVWWFGDLNFRLEGEDTPEEVRDAVLRGDIKQLFARDQLTAVRISHKAFHNMSENIPEFLPTFKFKEGTTEYDLKRRPAWCDRILYACQLINRYPNLPLDIKQNSYKSHDAYTISDHRPVSGEFTIKLFPNVREPCVVFRQIDLWIIDKENTVEYTKPLEFEERKHDWIGIYPVGYVSLRDHVGYEYVNQSDSSSSSNNNDDDDAIHQLEQHQHHLQHLHHNRTHHTHIQRVRQAEVEQVRLDFGDNMELKHGKFYQLIYFQSTGIRGVTSIAGMSNEFLAQERTS